MSLRRVFVLILDFLQAGVTAIRRVRKSDNNRIARACGATIVNRTEELKEEDVGTKCGLFEIKKVSVKAHHTLSLGAPF